MTRRHRLVIEPMTAESFAPFGRLVESSGTPGERRVMTPARFECGGRTTVHTIWQPRAGRSFSRLERHFDVTQTFFQLSGSPSVVCVAPPTDPDDPHAVPRPEDVRAFLIDPGKGFSFEPGTWHSLDRYVLAPPGATFVILNVAPNPTQIVDYADGTSLRFSDLDTDPAPVRHTVDTGPPLEFHLQVGRAGRRKPAGEEPIERSMPDPPGNDIETPVETTAGDSADGLSMPVAAPHGPDTLWFPGSRRPELSYRFYAKPPSGYMTTADRLLLADLEASNLQPGLDEAQFRDAIRSLLAAIPIAGTLLEDTEDMTLTRADVDPYLETIASDDFSANDLWLAFVHWMAYFFPDRFMKQEIAEIGIRRAQLLDH